MTRLSFEAPIDLSVGRVRISDADRVITDWVATPDNRNFQGDVEPGFYSAEISPAGVAPQSVIFEVREGKENDVVMPPFASLQANSGNTTFLHISDVSSAIDALFSEPTKLIVPANSITGTRPARSYGQAILDKISKGAGDTDLPDQDDGVDDDDDEEADEQSSSAQAAMPLERHLAVALSKEGGGRDAAFRPFEGAARMELSEGRLELTVAGGESWTLAPEERVRLSASIEDVRVERLYLPMYRGGVQITVLPSPLSPVDVELEILPSDPRMRALVRALQAGTTEDAKAVRSLLEGPATAIDGGNVDSDPWELLLSALLAFRFPDVFQALTDQAARELLGRVPWAYDSYVICARQRLYSSSPNGDRAVAADDALELLRKAQVRSSPYFVYVNQLFSELIEALVVFFDRNGPAQSRKKAAKIRSRWVRERTLQSSAGASFTWLRRDQTLLKQGILAPDRKPSGRFNSSAMAILFNGRISGGKIGLEPQNSGETASSKAEDQSRTPTTTTIDFDERPSDCPADSRPLGPPNDPNLGRFGEESSVGGFTLRARFDEAPGEQFVTITLIVEAERGAAAPGAIAWFCLHPSFHPQWIKVMFGNGRAQVTVRSWGGFTVGVWLPDSRVELELDLSDLPDAPDIVREL